MKKLIVLFCLTPLVLFAAEKPEVAALRQQLSEVLPAGMKIDSITATQHAGLYEVLVGSEVFYVTRDGHYMLNGDLIDLKSQQNISETRRNGLRKTLIDAVDEKDMIIFGQPSAKHTITVFTDIDCGYCRKLHREIDSYLQLGFRVRYLSYPRAGIGSDSYQKAVSVWCAKDRNKALTLAKGGATPERRQCDNPVAKEFSLGQRIGVRGTPTIVLEDGRLIPGYVPAGRLLQIINKGQ
jgi:thiol:disulfide interchange protein DsbC